MLGDLGRFLAVVACNPVKRLLYASNGAAGAVGKEFGEALLREHPYPAMAAEAERIWCGSVLRPWEALMPS